MLVRGDFDVAMDFQCSFVVEPDIDIEKFQSVGVSDRNFARYKDPVLDDLFVKQAQPTDPEERKKHLRAFEKRLLDEEVHYIYTLQWHRIIPHSSKVKGWTITPGPLPQQPARHRLAGGVARRGGLGLSGSLLCGDRLPGARTQPAIDRAAREMRRLSGPLPRCIQSASCERLG